SAHNIGVINYEIALLHYNDEEYKEAYYYMNKAGSYNKQYTYSLEFIRILIEQNKKEEASKALQNPEDTITDIYHLRQKSELFLKLKDYKNALKFYTLIHEKDTSINNNEELARTMEGVGEYNVARGYLVADTSTSWNKKNTLLNLFLHDLKYHSGDTCLSSYDSYRELGYTSDPFAAYRLKLFISYPLLPWKFHDFLGALATVFLLIVFILIPYFWILPLYFIGHRWKIVDRSTPDTFIWGLKSFWLVSSGYFIASFAATLIKPELLNWLVNVKSYSASEMTSEEEGVNLLIFVLFFAFFGFATLYRVNVKALLPKAGKTGKMIATTIGFFIILRIITLIYIQIGIRFFDVKADDLTYVPNLLFSSRKDILGLISTYGGLVGILIIGIFVPIYEEIIFRGVILESAKRYIHYNWALILQATLFATIHQQLFLFPVFFGFGIVTALLNKKFGGLIPGIILHIINNTIVVSSMIANHT
ncbi:MAG: CPBP family intramembrane metalloprotease, partial [Ignavibacteriae bacterium]|nr:CPBP family intramembrane metalloprotease [Ignavibacteriota bacterium]